MSEIANERQQKLKEYRQSKKNTVIKRWRYYEKK